MTNDKKILFTAIGGVLVCILLFLALVFGIFWGWPQYKIYSQRLDGEAILAKAESERRVLVETAKAKKDAAKLEAEAEIERAKGVAEANRIVADGLKGNDNYIRYLWVSKISSTTGPQIIYVPTEAGLPILESQRLK